MINSQRIVILVIVLNTIIGMVIGLYANPEIYARDPSGNLTQQSEGWRTDMQEGLESGGVLSDADAYQPTFGNPVAMGKTLADILGKAANPFSIPLELARDWMEYTIMSMLEWVRLFLIILMVIEIYFIIINRKVT